MFLLATIQTTVDLNIQSISYIDNCEFPGGDGMSPPGPIGYQVFMFRGGLPIVPWAMFLLNNWLADGLLVSSLFGVAFTRPAAGV